MHLLGGRVVLCSNFMARRGVTKPSQLCQGRQSSTTSPASRCRHAAMSMLSHI
jgi:hypothetical protein